MRLLFMILQLCWPLADLKQTKHFPCSGLLLLAVFLCLECLLLWLSSSWLLSSLFVSVYMAHTHSPLSVHPFVNCPRFHCVYILLGTYHVLLCLLCQYCVYQQVYLLLVCVPQWNVSPTYPLTGCVSFYSVVYVFFE